MKYLIVNGDDFGASHGINRGIVEAHRRGILTSATLMVNMPASEEAALLSRELPELSIGLHANFMDAAGEAIVTLKNDDDCRAELRRQVRCFHELMGCLPTHLDSHRNVHRDPKLLPCFLDFAQQHGLPLREHSPARYFSKFYGQWAGETHLDQISPRSLVQMLRADIEEGFTELSCHPGYVEADFPSSYATERETELWTLCDPRIRSVLAEQDIRLISFRHLRNLLADGSI